VIGKLTSVSTTDATVQTSAGSREVATPISLSSVSVGNCVAVIGGPGTVAASPTQVVARTVTVSGASGCGPGLGPAGPGSPSSPAPAPAHGSGIATPDTGAIGGPEDRTVLGTVTSVNASSFVVTAVDHTAKVTVETDRNTTFAAVAAATSSDLVVGKCAKIAGTNNADGSVTASTITISPLVAGGCSAAVG